MPRWEGPTGLAGGHTEPILQCREALGWAGRTLAGRSLGGRGWKQIFFLFSPFFDNGKMHTACDLPPLFSGVYTVVQPPQPSISRMFAPSQTETIPQRTLSLPALPSPQPLAARAASCLCDEPGSAGDGSRWGSAAVPRVAGPGTAVPLACHG